MKDVSEIFEETRTLKECSGLSIREIARRMGLEGHWAQVQRVLGGDGTQNMTLRTLLRFVDACGYEMEISFRRKRNA